MMTKKGSLSWNQKFSNTNPVKDDELNIINLFSDDETPHSPEITTDISSPNGFFDDNTEIFDFSNSTERSRESSDFGSQGIMDLFDSDDDDKGSACSSARHTECSFPSSYSPSSSMTKGQPVVEVHNQQVDDLQRGLSRLREEKQGLVEICHQTKKTAENWRNRFDEANNGNKIREAILEGQRKDIELLKNETCRLLETVERLSGTIASNNGKMIQERQEGREERLHLRHQLQQSIIIIENLRRELEEHKIAAKQTTDGIKLLHDQVKGGHDWILQYKTEADHRIRQLEEQCQLLRAQKEIQTQDATTTTQPADDGSKSQNRQAEDGGGEDGSAVQAEIASHAFICLWEYCNLVCPDADSLRSHMREEHMQ